MSLRYVFRAVVLIAIVALALVAVTGVLGAGEYYYRWTAPVPSVSCSTDGDVFLSTSARTVEFNLPTGASLNVYFVNNGTEFFAGNVPLPAGSGTSVFAGFSDNAPAYPLVSDIRYETLVNGTVVYISTLRMTCLADGDGTAEIIDVIPEGAAGGGCGLPLTAWAVVGDMPLGAQAYYAPGQATNITIKPGTYWVLGTDESGDYYKILLACQYLWVRTDTMQPSFQSPWTGQALPTQVVE